MLSKMALSRVASRVSSLSSRKRRNEGGDLFGVVLANSSFPCEFRMFGSSAKKGKKKTKSATTSSGPGRDDLKELLDMLDPVNAKPVPPMTPEQKEVLKEYTRGMQRRHNIEQASHSRRTKMMRKAIDALPPNLQAAAEEIDVTPFPFYPDATDTPPKLGVEHKDHQLW